MCWVLMWVLLLGGVLSRLWKGVWVGSSNSTLQSTSNVHTHGPHPHITHYPHTHPKLRVSAGLVDPRGSWVYIHVQGSTSLKIHIVHSPRPNQGDELVVLVGPRRRSTIHNPRDREMGTNPSLHLLQQRSHPGGRKRVLQVSSCVAVGDLPGMVLGGGWVEWKEEIKIKEVFIGWAERGRAPPKRTLQK